MNQEQKKFADEMAKYIQKHASKYGIKVCSPILAQAILETGWGTSKLAIEANNYFGLKYNKGRCPTACGSYQKIGSEQNKDGSYSSSLMEWFKFKNKEDCVIGYFDFINTKRYENLKGVTCPEQYLVNIRADGYATSLDYVKKLTDVINKNDLTKYDSMPSQSSDSGTLYRVQVGVYKVKQNADDMYNKLRKAGFNAAIIEIRE